VRPTRKDHGQMSVVVAVNPDASRINSNREDKIREWLFRGVAGAATIENYRPESDLFFSAGKGDDLYDVASGILSGKRIGDRHASDLLPVLKVFTVKNVTLAFDRRSNNQRIIPRQPEPGSNSQCLSKQGVRGVH
jgi:hypothetical protein